MTEFNPQDWDVRYHLVKVSTNACFSVSRPNNAIGDLLSLFVLEQDRKRPNRMR